MHETLRDQFHHYLENQSAYVREYNGKVIVLKNFEVIGVYQTELEAITKTQEAGNELGTFLVQKVTPGSGAYTVNIATPSLIHV